jgi:hypothetical protein
MTMTTSGAPMYMLKSQGQPGVFRSIPAVMWWAIETLTTVGYGDMVPITAVGRLLGGAISIVGIGTLALFSGLITVGFLDQLKTHRERISGSGASRGNGRSPGNAHPTFQHRAVATVLVLRTGFWDRMAPT